MGYEKKVTQEKRPERPTPLITLPTIRRYRGTLVPRQAEPRTVKSESEKTWLCLGAPVGAVPRQNEITEPKQLVGRDKPFWQALAKTDKRIKPWLMELQTLGTMLGVIESLPWSEELVYRPAEGVPRTILDVAGGEYEGKERSGPTPSYNYHLLSEMQNKGYDTKQALKTVIRGKLMRPIQDSSVGTYTSHEKGIRRFCELTEVPAVPATREVVNRHMSTIDNPSTMRGHMAAWRGLHTIEGLQFPEEDGIYKCPNSEIN